MCGVTPWRHLASGCLWHSQVSPPRSCAPGSSPLNSLQTGHCHSGGRLGPWWQLSIYFRRKTGLQILNAFFFLPSPSALCLNYYSVWIWMLWRPMRAGIVFLWRCSALFKRLSRIAEWVNGRKYLCNTYRKCSAEAANCKTGLQMYFTDCSSTANWTCLGEPR